jgi:hypothetical protein
VIAKVPADASTTVPALYTYGRYFTELHAQSGNIGNPTGLSTDSEATKLHAGVRKLIFTNIVGTGRERGLLNTAWTQGQNVLKRVETLSLAELLLDRLALPVRDLHPWDNLVCFALESSFSKTDNPDRHADIT